MKVLIIHQSGLREVYRFPSDTLLLAFAAWAEQFAAAVLLDTGESA